MVGVGVAWQVFTSKPCQALLILVLLLGATELQPLAGLKVLTVEMGSRASSLNVAPEPSIGETTLETETVDQPELEQPNAVDLPASPRGLLVQPRHDPGPALPSLSTEAPPVLIDDPTGSLDPFYEALSRTALKQPGAVTRISYFGDSLVASDYVTATLRRKLQGAFGDAGHGFMLIANAWPSYFHNDVFRFATRGFKVSRIVGPYTADGLYGLGGVSFSAPSGVRAQFGTASKGEFGRAVSKFSVLYLQAPHGGVIKLNLDGVPREEVDTQSPTPRSGFHTLNVPDGEHLLEIVTARGMTRLFGVTMEREGPGVVLDALGIQGARIRFLDKQNDAHFKEQLVWRSPHLFVYHFGANESGDGFAYSMEDFHQTMKQVLLEVHEAVPSAGCLVLSAMDRARKVDVGMITVPIIPHIVREQKKTAAEVGCAFWNTFEAMGGAGSMAKWVRRGIGQADLTHPNGVGAEILGTWLYRALIAGYEAYRERQIQALPLQSP